MKRSTSLFCTRPRARSLTWKRRFATSSKSSAVTTRRGAEASWRGSSMPARRPPNSAPSTTSCTRGSPPRNPGIRLRKHGQNSDRISGFPEALEKTPMARSTSSSREKAGKEHHKAEVKLAEVEAQKKRLKNLIVLGKERGYLTYAEINDHLPDDMTDAEQIEGVVTMLADMGIAVYDEAPDAERLLMTEAPAPIAEEDVIEEAEEALSTTIDAEFGRTTDPVRMYMREMGSVELLTREGEIEIAKRIEDGLKHMIHAISSCPTTIEEILRLAELIEKDEMRIDELVDGLVDSEDEEVVEEELTEEEELEELDAEEQEAEDEAVASADLEQLKQDALVHFTKVRRLSRKIRK